MHTTLDLTSNRVHAIGLERMADIRSQMQQLLDEAGFAGSPTDYLEHVKRDPRWRASGAEAVGAGFPRYIDSIAPPVEPRSTFNPKADHGASPLLNPLPNPRPHASYS